MTEGVRGRMRITAPSGALAGAAILAASIAACDDFKVNSPAAPSHQLDALQLQGPDTIEPSGSGQFTVLRRSADGTLKPVAGARWFSSNPLVLLVNAAGVATGRNRIGDATITAHVAGVSGGEGTASREVIVVPNGTFRVTGRVSDAEFPAFGVVGARVEVSPTVFATTDTSGQYQLYALPPQVQLTITGSGYQPLTDNLSLTGHATRNYSLLPSASRIALSGNYTLGVDALGPCSGLPADLQHRRYEARVAQSVLDVTVTLTEPRFLLNSAGKGSQFFGTINVARATFILDTWHYYHSYPHLAERLPDGSILIVYGLATTTATGGGVSGPLDGSMVRFDSRFPAFVSVLGSCSTQLQLSLTPR